MRFVCLTLLTRWTRSFPCVRVSHVRSGARGQDERRIANHHARPRCNCKAPQLVDDVRPRCQKMRGEIPTPPNADQPPPTFGNPDRRNHRTGSRIRPHLSRKQLLEIGRIRNIVVVKSRVAFACRCSPWGRLAACWHQRQRRQHHHQQHPAPHLLAINPRAACGQTPAGHPCKIHALSGKCASSHLSFKVVSFHV